MKKQIMKGASILTIVMMIGVVFTPLAGAFPIQPDNRFGVAYDSGASPIVGDYVLGFIDGVQYGLSAATDGSGYFMIDVAGYDPIIPVPKSGGDDTISDLIQYVRSPAITGLTTADGGTFFTETRLFTPGTSVNLDLNEVASSPALLKIDRVITSGSWAADGNCFAIYNPTGADVAPRRCAGGRTAPR